MGTAERAAVRRGLDSLKPYIEAFVAQHGLPPQTAQRADTASLLKALLAGWEHTYATHLPRVARSYVHELLDVRNRWAHEQPFSKAEASRALDTVEQLARVLGAPIGQPMPAQHTVAPAPHPPLRWSGQRALMREIFSKARRQEVEAIREYAAAERAGKVQRKGNKSGLSAEEYAKALIRDGLKKGWLT